MNNWKQDDAFLNMDPQKRSMIELLSATLEGKKLTEALPVLTEWKKQMQRENIVFTQEENQLLTQIFSSQLTPAQRQQYEYLKHFIK
ncbi:MAG: hypothetical protein J5979_02100 [Lachnospiraceae bacterium]|nr:hypothetical protein [Lachnospiraceae bacterium]